MAISAAVRSGCDRQPALGSALTITKSGLLLGGTVLAGMERGGDCPKLAIGGAEDRILALLAAVYGKAVRPGVLGNIRRASTYWSRGEPVLAEIELALAGLPPLADAEAARRRLGLAEKLLAAGVPAFELMKACGLGPGQHGLLRAGYNPDQPRVPAGNPTGGRCADSGAAGGGDYGSSAPPQQHEPPSAAGGIGGHGAVDGSSTPSRGEPPSGAGALLINYKVIKEPPRDAKAVIPSDGVPISGGDPATLLIVPPSADYRQIYQAGQAILEFPPWKQYDYVRAAIGQEGTYDFQRDVANQKFYQAYTPAANYAVGVYMAGAGYTLDTTLELAKLYALRNSRNYGTEDQLEWIKRGWHDAKSGRWR
jgi:hypothetical protein